MQHAFSAPACRATVWLARAAALGAVAIWLALGSLARADPTRDRLYLRAGMLYLRPIPTSPDVVMSNLDGPAELALPNGPIAGSGVGAESNTMLAGIIGYRVYKNVAVEADTSVAPFALGNVPTGVPAFGSELGTTKVLPPILTAVYRFPLHARVRPYGGLGLSYVIPYDTKITNAVLTEVSQPSVDISPDLAWVVQAGVDIQLWRQMYFTLDAKFVGGLDLVAEMNNLELTVPALPIYGTVSAGTGTAEVTVNPLVVQAGVGWNF
jgi:outer membrane protein